MTKREICVRAFLDGFSGAGLYDKLRRPGAPTQGFADPVVENSPVLQENQEEQLRRLAKKSIKQEVAHIAG